MASELHLRIVTPDRTIVDRKVSGVSFVGVDGGYGILPGHAPLMTAISSTGTLEVTEANGEKLSMFVSDGFAQMQQNVLKHNMIFLKIFLCVCTAYPTFLLK